MGRTGDRALDPTTVGLHSPHGRSRRSLILALLAAPLAGAALAASPAGSTWLFASIDGGTLDLADFRGGPVLIVNTASRCGFTPQFDGLQALWERYRERGLTVVGVPSHELRPGARQHRGGQGVLRGELHARFPDDRSRRGDRAGRASVLRSGLPRPGYAPTWNFHKILLDGEGRIVAEFGTRTEPDDPALVAAIEALLPR